MATKTLKQAFAWLVTVVIVAGVLNSFLPSSVSRGEEEKAAAAQAAKEKQALEKFDKAVELFKQAKKLEKKAKELKAKEADIEKIIFARVADVKERIREESTSSRGLFKSALTKAEKVFDQNKITRFVYSTISKFQEDFDKIQAFQKTRTVTDKDGKLITIIINQFSEDCYQDLFLFFYKYYNELTEIYNREKEMPSTADEIARGHP